MTPCLLFIPTPLKAAHLTAINTLDAMLSATTKPQARATS